MREKTYVQGRYFTLRLCAPVPIFTPEAKNGGPAPTDPPRTANNLCTPRRTPFVGSLGVYFRMPYRLRAPRTLVLGLRVHINLQREETQVLTRDLHSRVARGLRPACSGLARQRMLRARLQLHPVCWRQARRWQAEGRGTRLPRPPETPRPRPPARTSGRSRPLRLRPARFPFRADLALMTRSDLSSAPSIVA